MFKLNVYSHRQLAGRGVSSMGFGIRRSAHRLRPVTHAQQQLRGKVVWRADGAPPLAMLAVLRRQRQRRRRRCRDQRLLLLRGRRQLRRRSRLL